VRARADDNWFGKTQPEHPGSALPAKPVVVLGRGVVRSAELRLHLSASSPPPLPPPPGDAERRVAAMPSGGAPQWDGVAALGTIAVAPKGNNGWQSEVHTNGRRLAEEVCHRPTRTQTCGVMHPCQPAHAPAGGKECGGVTVDVARFLVVSLPASADRRENLRAQFAAARLPAFEVVGGVIVEPATLQPVPAEVVARLGLHGRPAFMLPAGPDALIWSRPREEAGSLGTALAHRAAWRAVADGTAEWAVVLEDDVALELRHAARAGAALRSARRAPRWPRLALTRGSRAGRFEHVPAEADIVLLYPGSVSLAPGGCPVAPVTLGYGLPGALLSRDGARRLLARSQVLFHPADAFFYYPSYYGDTPFAVHATRAVYAREAGGFASQRKLRDQPIARKQKPEV
jgi:GR25 family glycosyltransferase involved in LPS biosynthesis